MINFNCIRFQNFLSYGNEFTEINLNKSKKTLILGENGNGKTVFLDAVSFALYGKPFRKGLNKPNLINSITMKNMLVEVEFSTNSRNYLIRRGMKPNVFEIYENGNLIDQSAANKDYQKFLEENILKINHRAFSQIVMIGSANYTPFMELAAAQRRTVIEDLLDIQIFSTMNQLLKEKIASNKEEIRNIESELKLVQSKIDMSKEHANKLISINNDQIALKTSYAEELKTQNISLKEQNKDFSEKLKELASNKKNLDKIVKSQNKLLSYQTTLNTKKNQLNKNISFYQENDVCPTCKQSLTDDTKHEHISENDNKLSEITQALSDLDKELTNIEESISNLKIGNKEYEELSRTILKNDLQIDGNKAMIQQYLSEIKDLKSRNKELANAGDVNPAFIEQKEALVSDKDKILTHREVYGIATTLLKDTGIKAHIIKQYIPIMNQIINKYLAAMDFFVKFEIDENFEEKILSRHRDNFRYSNFSQGEKFRIDLALMFAWREIAKIRSSTSTNLLIMDEILDGPLDAAGVDDFVKILDSLTDTNVFIVSHRQEQLADRFNQIIHVEKKSNFSKMRMD